MIFIQSLINFYLLQKCQSESISLNTLHMGLLLSNTKENISRSAWCMKTLSNGTVKPSLLKRHLDSYHPEKKHQNESYSERLGENVKKQSLDQTGQNYQKMAGIIKASNEVFLLVAQNMKADTIFFRWFTPPLPWDGGMAQTAI